MAFKCGICTKGPTSGFSYSHSHRATKRVFRPNLQRQKVVLDGKTRTTYVCTDCIRSGRVVRPSK
ncbi:MAG: 50S ribosomal protein L28 [Elusimicrobia bacterium]|nr:50S ribosomal protein L28 [Elusimicrobiota bacterium]